MSNTVIKVENLTKTYKLYDNPSDRFKEALNPFKKQYHKKFDALNDISFQVKKGETIGIIGKNGSGKSTLLKIITGVLSPTNGNVQVQGKILALLELGTGFNPEYTGIENIYLNGTMIGYTKDEIENKINDILNFADIGDFVHQPVKTYSSGMFARLAFSVMIHFEPEILIVDEALAVGDIFFQQKCNVYMKEKMDGVTKLLVTHDMNSISNLADRAIVLSGGRNVFEGDPLKAIEFYTKSMHNEVFLGKNDLDTINNESVKETRDSIAWIPVGKEALGGAMDVKILAYNLQVDGEDYKGYVKKDNIVDISIRVLGTRDIDNLIFGYTVKDKYGNAIFAENTYSSGFNKLLIKKNKEYRITLTVKWPEVQENDYFITLGIGEGTHEMQHIIQCWAHNIIQIKNIALRPMHGIFNNEIQNVEIIEFK